MPPCTSAVAVLLVTLHACGHVRVQQRLLAVAPEVPGGVLYGLGAANGTEARASLQHHVGLSVGELTACSGSVAARDGRQVGRDGGADLTAVGRPAPAPRHSGERRQLQLPDRHTCGKCCATSRRPRTHPWAPVVPATAAASLQAGLPLPTARKITGLACLARAPSRSHARLQAWTPPGSRPGCLGTRTPGRAGCRLGGLENPRSATLRRQRHSASCGQRPNGRPGRWCTRRVPAPCSESWLPPSLPPEDSSRCR